MTVIPREVCRDMNGALANEWLVRNGRGSYASATISGALTRRAHGLLVAPLDREQQHTVLLAKLDEEVEVEGHLYKFGTNEYQTNIVNPDGFLFLEQVILEGAVTTFMYQAGRFQLSKMIWMEPGKATSYIRYGLTENSASARITLVPLCDYRSVESLTQGKEDWHFQVRTLERGFRVTAHDRARPYSVLAQPGASFTPLGLWYWRFQLRHDGNVGTDLYVPGLVRARLAAGETFTVIASCEPETDWNIEEALARARAQQPNLVLPPPDQFTADLFHEKN